MAVALKQSPNLQFDQAYGPNAITLEGIPTDVLGIIQADKYVLQVVINGQIVADLRQTPNKYGLAIFDIQNVLQNFVSPSFAGIETIGYDGADPLINSRYEQAQYNLRLGYEQDGVTFIETPSSIPYSVFGGTKQYYQVPYSPIAYIPYIQADGACTLIEEGDAAQAFTALNTFKYAADLADAKPVWLQDWMRVYEIDVELDDMYTLSFNNTVRGTGPVAVKSIDLFRISYYDEAGISLGVEDIYNIQQNGGGPNTVIHGTSTPLFPYGAITCGTGPQNITLPLNTAYYYVSVHVSEACATGVELYPSFHVYKFNIVTANCQDFEAYQFSWLNKFGFRDYYTFKKRKDRQIQVKRNTYLQETADYNGLDYNVSTYSRGETVYSQSLDESYVAFTDFLNDAEALYLQDLFTSADVKVRFAGAEGDARYNWTPISIITQQYQEKTIRKDKLFQYSINFKLANKLKSQRG